MRLVIFCCHRCAAPSSRSASRPRVHNQPDPLCLACLHPLQWLPAAASCDVRLSMFWVTWAFQVVLLIAIALCFANRQIHSFKVRGCWEEGSRQQAAAAGCQPQGARNTGVCLQFSLWSLSAIATALALGICSEFYRRVLNTPDSEVSCCQWCGAAPQSNGGSRTGSATACGCLAISPAAAGHAALALPGAAGRLLHLRQWQPHAHCDRRCNASGAGGRLQWGCMRCLQPGNGGAP